MLGWCSSGKHDDCPGEIEKWYHAGKSIVYTGIIIKCECPKRGCDCYVKKADRTKKTKPRKKVAKKK